MSGIAKVIVDLALDREFDYRIPPRLKDSVFLGSRVTVPFGNRHTTGYVVGFAEHSDRAALKEILAPIGDKPFIDERRLRLAKWMAGYYAAPLETAVRALLPGAVRRRGSAFKKQMYVTVGEKAQRHKETEAQRDPEVGTKGEEGKETEGEDLPSAAASVSAKQQAILAILEKKGGMFLNELLAEAGVTAAPVRALQKKGRVRVEPLALRRDPLANRTILRSEPLALMPEQAAALRMIQEAGEKKSVKREAGSVKREEEGERPETCRQKPEEGKGGAEPHVVLLYGVTGSGKTEVYLQAIDHVLKKGQGAIVLVPEISLTPQTVERFVGRFGDRIAVLHSHLSDGERHDEWHRIHDGKADIVVGARSAIFAPVRNLGLIVVDEEHEPSYKQEEAPRYHARDVAVMRGLMENSVVVLGSATPSVESWFNVRKGKYRLAVLPHRADNRKMPAMRVIDMRVETQRSGHVSVFSRELMEAVRLRLNRGEQTILFLNRRGFATSLICPQCGHVAQCGQCSVSCTYHKKDDELRCHICGDRKRVPDRCPGCGDPAFKYAGIGTQRVEAIITKCFPKARIQRMDADSMTGKDSYDRVLGDFRTGKIDILIGTQMIAKGLHFPNVTLVGVIYADMSLHIPDFRAGERTFQLLAQVAGRSGRGEVPGEVIIQTYTPFHPAVQAARRIDFEGFCDQEIEFRRELRYPPFTHLVCVTLKGRSESKVAYCAGELARRLGGAVPSRVTLSEATPAPLAQAKGFYRYQVMLRSASTSCITGALNAVLAGFRLPADVTCAVDVDAVSLL